MAAFTLSYSTSETPLAVYGPKIKILGVGGFGSVAKHKLGSRLYAVKTLLPDDTGENIVFENFLSEVVYPQCLDHPNIIKYSGIYYNDGQIAMVSDMARGDLSSISLTPFFKNNIPALRNVATQLISAVAYLEAHNVMHCDIKPQNVLCYVHPETNPGYLHVVLADFGLAQTSVCDRTMRQTGLYSLWYRAPEILKHQSYTEKAEVWALGCVFYEMLGLGPAFILPKSQPKVSNTSLSDDYSVRSVDDNNQRMLYLVLGRLSGGLAPLKFPDWTPTHFQDLILDMLKVYGRPSISDVQDHIFFDYPNREQWSVTSPCDDRITNLKVPDFIHADSLLMYSDTDLSIILNWMDAVVNYNVEVDVDLLRIAWLSKLMFLAYLSHNAVAKKDFQLYACGALFLIFNWYDATISDYTFANLRETSGNQYSIAMLRRAALDIAFDVKFRFMVVNPYDVLTHLTTSLKLKLEKNMATVLLMAASSAPTLVIRPDLAALCLKMAKGYLVVDAVDDPQFKEAMLKVSKVKNLHMAHSGLWLDYVSTL